MIAGHLSVSNVFELDGIPAFLLAPSPPGERAGALRCGSRSACALLDSVKKVGLSPASGLQDRALRLQFSQIYSSFSHPHPNPLPPAGEGTNIRRNQVSAYVSNEVVSASSPRNTCASSYYFNSKSMLATALLSSHPPPAQATKKPGKLMHSLPGRGNKNLPDGMTTAAPVLPHCQPPASAD